ncbi:MAG: GNAT family N-acetyltransferase [Pseudomonadota bacterium]
MNITMAKSQADLEGLEEIVREYLTWDIDQLCALSGQHVDVEIYVQNTFDEIDLYLPPNGRLLLVRDTHRLAAMGFLKPIRDGICEVKRMYVRPDYRGQGLGTMILGALIDAALSMGFEKILLDSAVYMESAHSLYRALGFTPVDYYEEGETDPNFAPYMVYMEKRL